MLFQLLRKIPECRNCRDYSGACNARPARRGATRRLWHGQSERFCVQISTSQKASHQLQMQFLADLTLNETQLPGTRLFVTHRNGEPIG